MVLLLQRERQKNRSFLKNDTNDENWAGIIFDTQIEEDTERTCEGATFEYCQFINGGEYLASDVEGMLSVDSTSDETDRILILQ